MINQTLPKISIVTPSFNQGEFLEETIFSVLSQNYPNLEYVIIDGGSTDNSIDIIRKYQDHLTYWISEPDRGQYDAINKGFAQTTGEIMAWINSDDKYTPWAFNVIAQVFKSLLQVEWLTTLCPLIWDRQGNPVSFLSRGGYTYSGFMRGENLPKYCIQQESVFWRRSLWERTGAKLDSSLRLAGDFELWTRFYQQAKLYTVEVPLGGFRLYGDQKSVIEYDNYCQEAKESLIKYGGYCYPSIISSFILGLKRYIKLPHVIRQILVKIKIKDEHNLCIYSIEEKTWKVKKI
ncbi:glycosyltransferase family 2 protein [Synechocystis sp. LKSZ1]|uniref:glycosyltransferase family 2 protein n=1 Tax=Synechocystis sp. LKSZ1 TaxID=3144951 RepID=UPI00336BC17B